MSTHKNILERELPRAIAEVVVGIIMDMHTLLGLTAKRARRAGASKKKTDEAFELSTIMVAKLLTVLNVDVNIVNKTLIGKLSELQKGIGSKESKEAVDIATANILGVDNDASA